MLRHRRASLGVLQHLQVTLATVGFDLVFVMHDLLRFGTSLEAVGMRAGTILEGAVALSEPLVAGVLILTSAVGARIVNAGILTWLAHLAVWLEFPDYQVENRQNRC